LFIAPLCFLNREYKLLQRGKGKEEKYFTGKYPSVPLRGYGRERWQVKRQAGKERGGTGLGKGEIWFRFKVNIR